MSDLYFEGDVDRVAFEAFKKEDEESGKMLNDIFTSSISQSMAVVTVKDITCEVLNTNVFTREVDEDGISLCKKKVANLISDLYCWTGARPDNCENLFQNYIEECVENENDTITVGDNGFDDPRFTLRNKTIDCSSFFDEVESHRWNYVGVKNKLIGDTDT